MVNYLHHLGFDAYPDKYNRLSGCNRCYLPCFIPSYVVDQLPKNQTEFGLGLREEINLMA
jgi:hypothetical protein